MSEIREADLQDVIEDVVRQRLSADFVDSVMVARGVDFEGEPDLRVRIVMRRPFDDAELDRMLGLVGHLRSRLAEIGCEDFPLVDYMSPADAARLNREAARSH